MLITWKADRTGLDLRPTWEVESVSVHAVKQYHFEDGTMGETFVLHARASVEQIKKLQESYGDSIAVSILGLAVLPIRLGHPIWIWAPPKGYEDRLKSGSYYGFEITS